MPEKQAFPFLATACEPFNQVLQDPIQIGRLSTHITHNLIIHNGALVCTSCGSRGTDHLVNLAKPCTKKTKTAGKAVLDAVAKGNMLPGKQAKPRPQMKHVQNPDPKPYKAYSYPLLIEERHDAIAVAQASRVSQAPTQAPEKAPLEPNETAFSAASEQTASHTEVPDVYGAESDHIFFGLSEQATVKDLERAYRLLARRLHPDKVGGSAEATKAFQYFQDRYERLRLHIITEALSNDYNV